jgi:hypothetical protein
MEVTLGRTPAAKLVPEPAEFADGRTLVTWAGRGKPVMGKDARRKKRRKRERTPAGMASLPRSGYVFLSA